MRPRMTGRVILLAAMLAGVPAAATQTPPQPPAQAQQPANGAIVAQAPCVFPNLLDFYGSPDLRAITISASTSRDRNCDRFRRD